MEKQLEEIKNSIIAARDDIGEIKGDLRYHIKRTDLLEKRVDDNEDFISEVSGALKFTKYMVTTIIALASAVFVAMQAFMKG